ncbi:MULTISPECIES: hypothetical protein [unclassified Streptomyces]|uniref:GNAT family N-acetyltransferase n=1 Tax=unclassified Streptomyces TaxID=2593676 RepID=UPI002DD84696|nr:hypothetical protein [Streptomyces sp. NBC_01750]WSA98283.1 hypothetical protein OIE54_02870 [Streptomyces sp. NBC_01794]WSD37180.1 hypothetical protein OG966_37915 [Streptomyces sp. NBC_01750]
MHATHWWIVEGDTYPGAVDLRHYLNAFLLDAGGHIGYSIRPSARRRGSRGIDANGGVLADMGISDKGAKRRYWITLEAVMRPRRE